MYQQIVKCTSVEKVTSEIYLLKFKSKNIAKLAKPGQFVNIKVDNSFYPLLRRPFSIFNVEGDNVSIVFNVVGDGTKRLSKKKIGDTFNVIGPCGNCFPIESIAKNSTAILIAGGLGVAPFPFLTSKFSTHQKFVTLIGARNKGFIITSGLKNLEVATEDGSIGFKGNVLQLLKNKKFGKEIRNSVIFTCGPMALIKVISEFAKENKIKCYASLECDMACGIGLCQGCNIETNSNSKKYELVCKAGPVFETSKIKL